MTFGEASEKVFRVLDGRPEYQNVEPEECQWGQNIVGYSPSPRRQQSLHPSKKRLNAFAMILLALSVCFFVAFQIAPVRLTYAAITNVQGPFKGTLAATTGSVVVNMTNAPAAGNTLILTFDGYGATLNPTISSISDLAGKTTWAKQISIGGTTGSEDVEIWATTSILSGASANLTIVLTGGSGSGGAVADVFEYGGLASSFLDKTATQGNTGASECITNTTVTTTQASELWIGCIGGYYSATYTTAISGTNGNGFTLLDGVVFKNGASSVYQCNCFLNKTVSATATASSGITASHSISYDGCIATFKAKINPPTLGAASASNVLVRTAVQFSCAINDSVGVVFWSFAWNNSGAWVNSSAYSTSGTSMTALYNDTWEITIGDHVSVQFWANDTVGNSAYSTVATFTLTRGGSVVGTSTSNFALAYSYQRKSFYASGRFWTFYANGTMWVYRTSTDAATWSAETVINATADCTFSDYYNGVYVYYALFYPHSPTSQLYFRSGTPNSDGTITWNAVQVQVLTTYNDINFPSIAVDTTGHVWIGYTDSANKYEYVTESGNTDGTWGTTASGFPYQLDSQTDQKLCPIPLTNGKMYFVWTSNFATHPKGRLWNGTVMGSEETITTLVLSDTVQYSAVADSSDNVYFALHQTSPYTMSLVKRTYNTGWESPVTIIANTAKDTVPLLSIVQSTGKLYCFFGTDSNGLPAGTTANHIYYMTSTNNGTTWSGITDLLDETTDTLTTAGGVYNWLTGVCFSQDYSGYIGFTYVTKSSSPYNVKFTYLIVSPSYSSLSTNTTVWGQPCKFSVTVNEDFALQSNGQYIFGCNNTGHQVNETAGNFTSTSQTLSVTKTLNSTNSNATKPETILFEWWFTDNAGGSRNTGFQTLTLAWSLSAGWNNVTIFSFDVGFTLAGLNASLNYDGIGWSYIIYQNSSTTAQYVFVNGMSTSASITVYQTTGIILIFCTSAGNWTHTYPLQGGSYGSDPTLAIIGIASITVGLVGYVIRRIRKKKRKLEVK